jgi:hypothetical protein
VEQETLARKLGTTAHLSPLLMKARGVGLRTPHDFEVLAIKRGCRYYAGATVPQMETQQQPKEAVFSNVELAIALMSLAFPKSQHRLRLGAAMLAAEGNEPAKIARLAIMERVDSVVRYIADCGQRVEPENVFWQRLVALLPNAKVPAKPDVLPHLTRFVAMTGFTRNGRETVMQWIRPTGTSTT